MKSKVYKRKVDTLDESFALILDADAGTNKREDHLGRGDHAIFAHGLQSAFDCDGEIFEHLLWTLANVSHLTRNKSVIETLKL